MGNLKICEHSHLPIQSKFVLVEQNNLRDSGARGHFFLGIMGVKVTGGI